MNELFSLDSDDEHHDQETLDEIRVRPCLLSCK